MRYGICQNVEERCQFSYCNRQLAHLHDALQRIQAEELRGAISQTVGKLQPFARYFQTGATCHSCGQALCVSLQPMTGIDPENHEYTKRIRLNHLLALAIELQARGVLTP